MRWLGGDDQEGFLPPPSPKAIKTGPTSQHKYDDNEPYCSPPSLGDVVAVPFLDDGNRPDFWLGKCLRVNTEDSTILLGWFQQVEPNKYKMKIGASWLEVCAWKK